MRRDSVNRPVAVSAHAPMAGVSLAGAAVLFVLLLLIVHQSPILTIDIRLTTWVQSFRSPGLDLFMQAVGMPGLFPQTLLVNALIIAIAYLFRMRQAALTLLVGGVLVGLSSTAVRYTLDRPRPTPDLVTVMQVIERGHYSFPSGHVVGFTAILGFLLYVGWTELRPTWHARLVLFLYALYILLVGVSRIYVGEHWASDVVGGYLLGALWLGFMVWFYRRRQREGMKGAANG